MLRNNIPRFELRCWTAAGVLSFCLTCVVTSSSALGEIVLDEFDDPFQIVLPDMNREYQSQLDVGPLHARRAVNGDACCGAKSTGWIDANLTVPSALYSAIDRVNPDPAVSLTAAIGINLLYFFDTTDVTQAGVNDRVVLDFAFLSSAIPLARVDVFMQDRVTNYVSQQFNISPQEAAFSLEFPFNTFAPRGGGAGSLDPTHVHTLYLTLIPVHFTTVDPLNFSAALERIRITSAIPEPDAAALVAISVVIGVWWSARKRRCSYEITNDFGAGCNVAGDVRSRTDVGGAAGVGQLSLTLVGESEAVSSGTA
jgi:hypothetical protein